MENFQRTDENTNSEPSIGNRDGNQATTQIKIYTTPLENNLQSTINIRPITYTPTTALTKTLKYRHINLNIYISKNKKPKLQ